MPKYYLVKDANTKKTFLIKAESKEMAENMIAAHLNYTFMLEWICFDDCPESLMVRFGVHKTRASWDTNFGGGAIPLLDVTNLLRG